MREYAPRATGYHGLRVSRGWRLKVYSVCAPGRPLDWAGLQDGLALAERALPQPAVSHGRIGAAFLIGHQGLTADYVVLAWWDRENELPLRVFVRDPGGRWRPARGSESICVWDLEIIWREREAWIDTVLAAGDHGAGEVYLARIATASDASSTGRVE